LHHGVTLHSYRYAWAERAKTVCYPERFGRGVGAQLKGGASGLRERRDEIAVLEDYDNARGEVEAAV